ncbi:MAG: PDZ domain-containing protein [Acidobacteria bacterium]|jgi:tricorn protease|nr:PDZ domain-containing protein [Acidobacteriota bacterium]
MRSGSRLSPALVVLLALLAGPALPAAAAADPPAGPAPGYLRYPDIHGGLVVFSAEADLWLTSDAGGPSRRLSTHPGNEYFPTFSPDGKLIAFTGEYDGNRDVYVVAVSGGEPRRLTWHPMPDEVVGWLPDGSAIVIRSPRAFGPGGWELFTVPLAGDPSGNEVTKLPLGWAARLDIDPATGAYAFNRISNEFRTWKRYRGGTAQDLWVGDPKAADFRRVTQENVTEAFPMWSGGRLWFLSDKGGTANLWSMKPDGSDRKQHTDLGVWDARWPAMGPDGRIVFMLAGDIALFDPKSGTVKKLPIELPSDRTLTRVRYPDAGRFVTWYDLAPDGSRVAIVARGEIVSVPVKEGVTLPVTRGSGARENWATFDAKGEQILFVSDAAREEEIRSIDAWGRSEATIVKPAGKNGWHFPPRLSPDGKWIAWADQTNALFVMPRAGGAPVQVDRSPQAEIRDYAWSPDGRWLAYSRVAANNYSSVLIYDTQSANSVPVTGPHTFDYSPAWDPEGRFLYFLSDRFTNPILGTREWNNVEARNTKLYMVLLRPDVENPLAPNAGLPPKPDGKDGKDGKAKDDEKKGGKKDDAKAGGKDGKGEKDDEIKPVEIELAGLSGRIIELPVGPGPYGGLSATKGKVFWIAAPLKGMAEQPPLFGDAPPENVLMAFDLEEKKAEPFVEGISDYVLSAKAGKIALRKQPGEIFVVGADAPPGPKLAEARLKLNDVVLELDPREEWAQIYYESWRNMRDFFWDAGMSGLDWAAIRDQYATLLPRLATRDDLRDLIGETIGELNTSHTYVWGGDPGVQIKRVPVGLLGADLVREGEAYKVVRIYRGDPADNVRSPLLDAGVGVKEGDFILAVNHQPFPKDRPWYAALEGLADKPVVLTVNSRPAKDGARDVVVKPLGDEEKLRYADWVRTNREYVATKTNGTIGYVHMPDMWTDGLVAFNTWFYPQLDKQGMVVDVRWNGGGAISQMVVDRLERQLISWDRQRAGGLSTYPQAVLNGPFVVLTNEFAGSDGDIFPMAIQLRKLAPVIGMRSWGGVVGIRGDKRTVDGGTVTHPEFAWWDTRQGWGLENRGVVPDIELQNTPQDLARGVDAQLDRAIAEVLQLQAERPPQKPAFGPPADKSRKGYATKER